MGPKFRIEPGTVFGKLTVIELVGEANRDWLYRCRCECGRVTEKKASALRRAHRPTRSCGCLAAKWTGFAVSRGGKSGDRLFVVWRNVIHRCHNPKASQYARYGGRGIQVCPRWRDSYETFAADMGPPPSDGHTLERVNNDGDYEPSNCRWATKKEQCRNRPGRNVQLTHGGRSMLLVEWAEETGISLGTLHARLKAGWDHEKALTTPVRKRRLGRDTG